MRYPSYSQVQEIILVFLNQSLISEAKVCIVTNYDMVQYLYLQNIPHKDQVSG